MKVIQTIVWSATLSVVVGGAQAQSELDQDSAQHSKPATQAKEQKSAQALLVKKDSTGKEVVYETGLGIIDASKLEKAKASPDVAAAKELDRDTSTNCWTTYRSSSYYYGSNFGTSYYYSSSSGLFGSRTYYSLASSWVDGYGNTWSYYSSYYNRRSLFGSTTVAYSTYY